MVMRCVLVTAFLAAACPLSAAAQDGPEPAQGEQAPPGHGAAAEAARHLAEGRRLYTELDFAATIDAMHRALSVPGVPEALRLEAFEYMGSAYVVLEQPREAREAFVSMFRLDPYHVVREPSGSPKIARFVEEVRDSVVDDAALDPAVRLRAQLPRAGRVGRATDVSFTLEGPPSVQRVSVYVRGVGDPEWETVATEREGTRFEAELPPRTATDELELYAEGRDRHGRVVTRAGEPLAPLTIPIRPAGEAAPGGSLFAEWWFWAGVGAAVAAGIAIGFGVSSNESAPAGTLPPGRVELP